LARYWKASSKEEKTAGKKLGGEIMRGNMDDFSSSNPHMTELMLAAAGW
jgi:hypothetical protein